MYVPTVGKCTSPLSSSPLSWADDEKEAEEFLKMGGDTILTNEFNLISQVVEKYKV